MILETIVVCCILLWISCLFMVFQYEDKINEEENDK